MTQAMLIPAATLIAWTLVMAVWMFATRIPAMKAARIHPQKAVHTRSEAMGALPSEVRQVADNYNHLMEQPTIFYAIALVLAVSGEAAAIDVWLAWAYVALRVAHSVWQATKNVVMIRFFIFLGATAVLFPLTGRALYLLLT